MIYRNQAERNTADIHRVIRIRVKSISDSEANTFTSILHNKLHHTKSKLE